MCCSVNVHALQPNQDLIHPIYGSYIHSKLIVESELQAELTLPIERYNGCTLQIRIALTHLPMLRQTRQTSVQFSEW